MKGFCKHIFLIFTLISCLLFFASTSQSYYGGPSPYPYYPPSANYSSPPVNINISMSGFPGSYPMGYPNSMGYFSSGYVGGTGPYGNSWMTMLPPTAESIAAAAAKFSFIHSASDGEYVYVAFQETKGRGRAALAVFEASDDGDFEYLSHITLSEGLGHGLATPEKIIIRDDLAIVGAMDKGTVYLVDMTKIS